MIVFLDFRIRENDGRRCAIAFKPIPLRWVGLPFFLISTHEQKTHQNMDHRSPNSTSGLTSAAQ
jgi:hypothetical protein